MECEQRLIRLHTKNYNAITFGVHYVVLITSVIFGVKAIQTDHGNGIEKHSIKR